MGLEILIGRSAQMKRFVVVAIACVALLSACNGGLDIVDVNAPAVNYIFDTDGTIVVTDTSDDLLLDGMVGNGFLQSRTSPPGEPGTAGEGLYAFEYRIDLREHAGALNIACATSFTIDFGAVSRLDYDSDGNLDDVYVVTTGGLGSIAPTTVTRSGDALTFTFSSGVCAGNAPGNGQSSFFFGIASAYPPHDVQAEVKDSNGHTYTLDARAPNFSP
jgi:hypothetical protein